MHFLCSVLNTADSCHQFWSVVAWAKFPVMSLTLMSMQTFQLIQMLSVHLHDSIFLVEESAKQLTYVPLTIQLMQISIYVSKIIFKKKKKGKHVSRIWRQDYLFCIIVKDLVLHLILLSTKNGDFSIRYSVFCASCALSKVVLGYPVKFCTYTTSQSSVLVCGSPLSENSSW